METHYSHPAYVKRLTGHGERCFIVSSPLQSIVNHPLSERETKWQKDREPNSETENERNRE